MTRSRALLASILLLYVALATLFAVYTPPWQAPDEPAHYNYVGYVAAHGDFPVLRMGDYSHTYLEETLQRRIIRVQYLHNSFRADVEVKTWIKLNSNDQLNVFVVDDTGFAALRRLKQLIGSV
jgi:hypothetical protein